MSQKEDEPLFSLCETFLDWEGFIADKPVSRISYTLAAETRHGKKECKIALACSRRSDAGERVK